jgi:hypothetical protein
MTIQNQIDQRDLLLGQLSAQISALEVSVRALTDVIVKEREAAATQRIEAAAKLSAVASDVAALRSDMDMVKPLAMKWVRWSNIGFGVFASVSVLGTAFWAAVNFFHEPLLNLMGLK